MRFNSFVPVLINMVVTQLLVAALNAQIIQCTDLRDAMLAGDLPRAKQLVQAGGRYYHEFRKKPPNRKEIIKEITI